MQRPRFTPRIHTLFTTACYSLTRQCARSSNRRICAHSYIAMPWPLFSTHLNRTPIFNRFLDAARCYSTCCTCAGQTTSYIVMFFLFLLKRAFFTSAKILIPQHVSRGQTKSFQFCLLTPLTLLRRRWGAGKFICVCVCGSCCWLISQSRGVSWVRLKQRVTLSLEQVTLVENLATLKIRACINVTRACGFVRNFQLVLLAFKLAVLLTTRKKKFWSCIITFVVQRLFITNYIKEIFLLFKESHLIIALKIESHRRVESWRKHCANTQERLWEWDATQRWFPMV